MSSPPRDDEPAADIAQLRRERDLYRKLLDLGTQDEIEPFLEEALALVVALAGARRGYVELRDESAEPDAAPFSIARGCSDDDVADIRAAFSQSVIAEAIATRQTIVAASAFDDQRFRNKPSVKAKRIEAVLCAPIGVDPPLGVLYLQDRDQPGPFTEDDRSRVETFARHISAFADRLLARRRRRNETDAALPYRRALRAASIVGRSPALAAVLQQVAQIAAHDVSVLLTGPSGTGKTQLARLIHENSPRRAAPFVEVNCAALPENLIESELFGAEKGAHSTATRKTEGKVAAAEGGTLFLDEIGELKLPAQAKLLQLLQSKEYYPLGSIRVVAADVRVIAASNADLKAAVSRRELREDLFYRLQVVPIRVPSLAERREDIALLAAHFCDRAAEAHKLPRLQLSPGALRAIEAAEWPGNIRELEHAISAAALRAGWEHALVIERRHVFPDTAAPAAGAAARLTYQQAMRRCQEHILRSTLDDTGWNVTETAKALDIARAHAYNLIRAFGLERGK
jgi:Nif-specific regulatory protein